jgi:DedD protein
MEPKLKERIVGATVIVALGIIIIPWLLDGPAQSPRSVEQAIELPRVEQPGRTYTIPLDPGAGPAVQVETGSDPQPVPLRSGGPVQRLPAEEPATPIVRPERSTPAASQPAQPAQPAPRPAPAAQRPTQEPPAPAPAAAATSGPWTVQVGSFSQSDNAQALQRRLAAEGFDAFVSRVATDAGTMHRVRVGPVPERAAADRLLARVSAAGHAGARVVRAED